jgi:RNA polymerase sigma factor (sigma-70 family)
MKPPTPNTNPFVTNSEQEAVEQQMITDALTGDKPALETLCNKHQLWIYNIARRMVLVPEDAEDITQEILIKMITNLSRYDSSKAAFRTWLYRIVANHVINMKKKKSESSELTFDTYYSHLANIPDEEPENTPEMQMVIADLKTGCLEGVLLCLSREKRLVFILAVVFGVPSMVGSEILEISASNYRKILSRAREQLFEYMNGNCGVINEKNSCHCRNKAPNLVKVGALSADRITFAQASSPSIRDVLARKAEEFNEGIYSQFTAIFRDHPFYKAPALSGWLHKLLEKPEFKEIFQLD